MEKDIVIKGATGLIIPIRILHRSLDHGYKGWS